MFDNFKHIIDGISQSQPSVREIN